MRGDCGKQFASVPWICWVGYELVLSLGGKGLACHFNYL